MCRRHPIVILKPVLIWLVTLVAGAAFGFLVSPRASGSIADNVAGWGVLLVTIYSGWQVVRWWMAHYVITDQRVLLIEGVVSVAVSAIPLAKVTDTTFTRTVWGRIFGYGNLLLDSPGEQPGISTLVCLPRPEQLYRLITSLVVGRVWDRSDSRPPARDSLEDDTGPIPRVIL